MTTPIDKNANTHVCIRPDWMTDEQWGHAVDKLGDLWNDLLREAAESSVPVEQRRRGAV